MINQRAFSLIELVVTMILISILAVTVLPKMFSSSDFSTYTVRDQLLSQLRAVQLQALNQRGVCHNLLLKDGYFGAPRNNNDTCGTTIALDDRIEHTGIEIKIFNQPHQQFEFDPDGRISNLVPDTRCLSCYTIKIIGPETLLIVIESQGYIHAL